MTGNVLPGQLSPYTPGRVLLDKMLKSSNVTYIEPFGDSDRLDLEVIEWLIDNEELLKLASPV